jgi:hypothetical protein
MSFIISGSSITISVFGYSSTPMLAMLLLVRFGGWILDKSFLFSTWALVYHRFAADMIGLSIPVAEFNARWLYHNGICKNCIVL